MILNRMNFFEVQIFLHHIWTALLPALVVTRILTRFFWGSICLHVAVKGNFDACAGVVRTFYDGPLLLLGGGLRLLCCAFVSEPTCLYSFWIGNVMISYLWQI